MLGVLPALARLVTSDPLPSVRKVKTQLKVNPLASESRMLLVVRGLVARKRQCHSCLHSLAFPESLPRFKKLGVGLECSPSIHTYAPTARAFLTLSTSWVRWQKLSNNTTVAWEHGKSWWIYTTHFYTSCRPIRKLVYKLWYILTPHCSVLHSLSGFSSSLAAIRVRGLIISHKWCAHILTNWQTSFYAYRYSFQMKDGWISWVDCWTERLLRHEHPPILHFQTLSISDALPRQSTPTTDGVVWGQARIAVG